MSIPQYLTFAEVMEQYDCYNNMYNNSNLVRNISIWKVFSEIRFHKFFLYSMVRFILTVLSIFEDES
jgi:hypothetical protein